MTQEYLLLRCSQPIRKGIGEEPMVLVNSLNINSEEIELEAVTLTPEEHYEAVNKDPNIYAAAPVMPINLIKPVSEEDAPKNKIQKNAWGIEAVKASESPCDGSGVTVAVLDTGIDENHPAFKGVELVQKNFIYSSNNKANDDVGHGTHWENGTQPFFPMLKSNLFHFIIAIN